MNHRLWARRNRFFALLLTIVLLAGLVSIPALADGRCHGENNPSRKEHEDGVYSDAHYYSDPHESTTATCTTGGQLTYQCLYCDYQLTVETGALGHDWGEWTDSKAGTCTEEGEQVRHCTRAGCTEEETRKTAMDPDNHSWGEWQEIQAGTCRSAGVQQRTCSACGKTETRETALNPDNHVWGEWQVIREATCVDKGLQERTCTICGEKETYEPDPDPTNHAGKTELRDAAEATCKKKGYSGDLRGVAGRGDHWNVYL